MKEDRLRRALLPTWPPESTSEAMLLLVCAAALRLLLQLWVQPGAALVAQPGVGDATLALLAALARPVALGLLLALAARVLLKAPTSLALGLGALLLAGSWPEPLLQGLVGLPSGVMVWVTPVCIALLAVPAARLARASVASGVLLAVCGLLLGAILGFYDAAHAWLLDALDLAVRGALVFGMSHARREALDSLPLLAFCLLGWSLLGGGRFRRLIAAAWLGRAWPVLLAAMTCLAWGFVVQGAALGAMPGVLQPPAVYALAGLMAGLLAGLSLARCWQARRTQTPDHPDAGELGMIAAWALALAYLAGLGAMLAAFLAGVLLAAPVLMPAGHRLPAALRLAGAALCALFLFLAGALAVPGATAPAAGPVLLGGLLGAGAAFAGLIACERSRLAAAAGLLALFAALAVIALGSGRGDMVLLCGALLVVMLLFLALPGRTPAGRTGDAALCCLGLLAAATAVFAA